MNRSAIHLLLSLGFLSLVWAIRAAWMAPAGRYERSIYLSTPEITWIGFAIAFAIAIALTIRLRGTYQGFAVALGGATATTIVAIPVIRNYRFLGMGDGLTHLGWVRDFLTGSMLPNELFYPGLHSSASVLAEIGGISPARSVLFVVVLIFVPFVVFVPLLTREITRSDLAIGISAIVSWMVLPINNVATHLGPHTNSNALFVVPVVLFAVVLYMKRQPISSIFGISPFGLLIFLTGLGLLFIHPQQMFNVVIVLASIWIVQAIAKPRLREHPITEHASVFTYTVVLAAMFTVWVSVNERFRNAVSGLVYGLLSPEIGAGEEVGQREASLLVIGGSIEELFVKLFLVGVIFSLLVGGFLLASWAGKTSIDLETKTYATYFGIALFPLSIVFLIYFIGTPTMAFRQVGFIFVIITILSGVALATLSGWLSERITPGGTYVAVSIVITVCLVLAVMTVFSSPFIYSPTQHVSDQTLDGYERSFDTRESDVPFAGLGTSILRFDHGIHGVESSPAVPFDVDRRGQLNPEAFNSGNFSGAYDGDRYYFVVTQADLERELEVYRELHYTRGGFESLERTPGVNKVVSNDEFDLYLIYTDNSGNEGS